MAGHWAETKAGHWGDLSADLTVESKVVRMEEHSVAPTVEYWEPKSAALKVDCWAGLKGAHWVEY